MMNVGNPEEAFALSFIPNDGAGLARGVHHLHLYKGTSLALLNYDRLDDAAVKAEIDRLTVGYANKAQFFVDKLAQGVAMIAAAFIPRTSSSDSVTSNPTSMPAWSGEEAMSRLRRIP